MKEKTSKILNRTKRMWKQFLALAIAIIILAGSIQYTAKANTIVTYTNLEDNLPASTIYITGFDVSKCEVESNSTGLILRTEKTLYDLSSTSKETELALVVLMELSGNKKDISQSNTGSITFRLKECGYDADGDKIDMKVTISDVNVYMSETTADYQTYISVFAIREDGNRYSYLTSRYGKKDYAVKAMSADIEIHFYKTGTDTDASGTYLFTPNNIDYYNTVSDKYEYVSLTSGFGDVYLANDCQLDVENGTKFSAPEDLASSYQDLGSDNVGSLVYVGFATTLSGSSTGEIRARTANSSMIALTNNVSGMGRKNVGFSAGDGGSISPSGNKVVYWGNTVSYTVTADTGYKISKITEYQSTSTYGGGTYTISSSYTDTYTDFENIYSYTGETRKIYSTATITNANYTQYMSNENEVAIVRAEFEPISYTITYDSNGGDGSIDDLSCSYDTTYNLASSGFTRTGYALSGWNTEADGSGTSYSLGQSVSNLTTEDDTTITLYAQWAANAYTITYNSNYTSVDSTETDSTTTQNVAYADTVMIQSNSFDEPGVYVFAGWNTKADGSGTSYTAGTNVTVGSTTNSTTIDVITGNGITLYAQWTIGSYDEMWISTNNVWDPDEYDSGEEQYPASDGYTGYWTIVDEDTWFYTFYVDDLDQVYLAWEDAVSGLVTDAGGDTFSGDYYASNPYTLEDGTIVATITNSNNPDVGSLTITKTLYDEDENTITDDDTEFRFTVTLYDSSGNALSGTSSYSGITFTDGVSETITLAAGETVTITNIPAGYKYSIEEDLTAEQEANGYSIYSPSSGVITGTISTSTVSKADFYNQLDDSDFGSLRITKTITASSDYTLTENDYNTLFTVYLTLTDTSGNTVSEDTVCGTVTYYTRESYTDTEYTAGKTDSIIWEAGGTTTVTVSGNQYVEIDNIPEGYTVTVQEKIDTGAETGEEDFTLSASSLTYYESSVSRASKTLTTTYSDGVTDSTPYTVTIFASDTTTNRISIVSFTNYKGGGITKSSLTITKEVLQEETDDDGNTTYSSYSTDETFPVTIEAGYYKTVTNTTYLTADCYIYVFGYKGTTTVDAPVKVDIYQVVCFVDESGNAAWVYYTTDAATAQAADYYIDVETVLSYFEDTNYINQKTGYLYAYSSSFTTSISAVQKYLADTYYPSLEYYTADNDGYTDYLCINSVTSSDEQVKVPLDGTYNGVTFTDGTAKVYLAAGDTITIDDIPGDTWYYSVVEAGLDNYTVEYSTTTNVSDTSSDTNEDSSVKTGTAVIVTITNIYTGPAYGNLYITKEVSYPEKATNKEKEEIEGLKYIFTITLYDSSGSLLTGVQTYGDVMFVNGVSATGTTITAGETISIEDIPKGYSYTVTETGSSNNDYEYSVTWSASSDSSTSPTVDNENGIVSGTIDKNVNISITAANTIELPVSCSLIIEKILTDPDGNIVSDSTDDDNTVTYNGEFKITVTFTDNDNALSGTEVIGGYVFTNGVLTTTITPGEVIVISGIEAEYDYTVTETIPKELAEYYSFSSITVNGTLSYESDGTTLSTTGSGTLVNNAACTVDITNEYTYEEPNYTDLILQKETDGWYSEDTNTYTFNISFTDLVYGVSYSIEYTDSQTGSEISVNDGSAETFSCYSDGTAYVIVILGSGETATFKNLPENCTYQISEKKGDYKAAYEITNTTDVGEIANSEAANTAYNKALSTKQETLESETDSSGNVTVESNTVVFTNTIIQDQDLYLTKNVTKGSTTEEFEFTISFSNLVPRTTYTYVIGTIDETTGTFTATGTEEDFTADSDGYYTVTITLSDGETYAFYDLPIGHFFNITEAGSDDYINSYLIRVLNDDGDSYEIISYEEDDDARSGDGIIANTDPGEDLSTTAYAVTNPTEIDVIFYNSANSAKARVAKIDEDGNYLGGAVFSLYKVSDDEDEEDTLIQEGITTLTADDVDTDDEENTSSSDAATGYSEYITGLTAGDYYFIETAAPDGYYVSDIKHEFTITDSDYGTSVTVTASDETMLLLANSGGLGILAIIIISIAGIGCTVIVVSRRRRRKNA